MPFTAGALVGPYEIVSLLGAGGMGEVYRASGESVSDAVAAILKNEPDWTALPADVPLHIRTLLRRCLSKDSQKRLPHVGVVRNGPNHPNDANGPNDPNDPNGPNDLAF
jgi:hypothetical protein